MNPASYPGTVPTGYGIAVKGPDEDKPPFFVPNRAAFRAASNPVKSRLRKARKWAVRVEDTSPELADMFRHLADGAERDLDFLKGARA